MSETIPTPEELQRDDDAGIAALLREVGAGDQPSAELTDDVRANVHAEWRAVVQERRRRRFLKMSWAASVAGIAASVVIAWQLTSSVEPVVTIARLSGTANVIAADGQRRPVTIGQRLLASEKLETTASSRVALDFGEGLSVRLDGDSMLQLAKKRRATLSAGAVYVDASFDGRRENELTLDTPFGAVRHVGTQYQVRVLNDGIEVGVREGRVEVSHSRGMSSSSAGEWLQLSASGDVMRSVMSMDDARFMWAFDVAPVFDIANRSLLDFLQWMARESGRKLVFDSPAAERAAAMVTLRGSIEGLDWETALAAVLSTTQLRRAQSNDDSIHIALQSTIETQPTIRPTP